MQSNKFFLIIAVLSFVLFWQKGIFQFLFAENMAGRDLIGNYAFAWLMHGFMQSFSVSGWSNLWFAGFPVFDFYPPLFFIAVNLLNFVSFGFVGLEMSYKIIVFLSLFVFPSVVYFSFEMMGFSKIKSLFASIFSFGFLFLNGHYAAVHQTLNFGLVSQIFSLNLLLLFFGMLFRQKKDKKNILAAGILLGLLILSHPFVAAVGLLGWFMILMLEKRKNGLLLSGIIGIALSSWWLASAFLNINFMNIYASRPIPISDFPILFVPFILAGIEKSKKVFLLLSLFILSLLAGTSGVWFITQPTRFFQYSLLFGMLLAGLGGYRIYEYVKNNFLKSEIQKIVLAGVLLIPLLFGALQAQQYKEWESGIKTDGLMREIGNLGEGRILVENGIDDKDYYALMEEIPVKTGKPVLTELHADSSISAPYALALQYWVSDSPSFNPLCSSCESGVNVSKDAILSDMKRFNVRYIITANEKTKGFLDGFKGDLALVKKVDGYYIFEAGYESQYYEILRYKPVLIVSSMENWKKVNEKIFADGELANLTFVWSGSEPSAAGSFGQIFEMQNGETAQDFYVRIKKYVSPANASYGAAVGNFIFSDKGISFDINSEAEVPVLLKFSYFPRWNGNSKIYLASPSLMLVFGKGKMEISY